MKYSAFKLFILSRGLGALADQFLMFAVPLTILQVYQSVSLAALSFVIEWLPRVFAFPVVGSLVDGRNLKKIFLSVEIVRIILMVGAIFAISFSGPFWTLSLLMSFMSLLYAVNFVSVEAMIPNNLTSDKFPKAHSWIQITEQIAQVVGPLLAISVYHALNIRGILLSGAALFLLSALILTRLNIKNATGKASRSLKDIFTANKVALSFLFTDMRILYLSAMTWVVNIIYGVALAISPAIVTTVFKLGGASLGKMQSFAAIAAVCCFYLIPKVVAKMGVSIIGKLSLLVILSSGLLMANAKDYVVFALAYALLIAFDGGFSVYIRTVRSTIIPQEHLAKVMGVVGMINLFSIPLGGAIVSLLSNALSLQTIILLSFYASLILTVLLLCVGRFKFGYIKWLPVIRAGSLD